MIVTEKDIKALRNGTRLTLFLAGSGWEEDFGKTIPVVKIDNKLYEIKSNYFNIEDIDNEDDNDDHDNDDLKVIAAIK